MFLSWLIHADPCPCRDGAVGLLQWTARCLAAPLQEVAFCRREAGLRGASAECLCCLAMRACHRCESVDVLQHAWELLCSLVPYLC